MGMKAILGHSNASEVDSFLANVLSANVLEGGYVGFQGTTWTEGRGIR
jgi:hypothetical protein